MRAVWICTTVCMFAADIMSAQPAANPLTFEVASVRPSAADAHGLIDFLPGGSLRASGMTLKSLISIAYAVRQFQISAGPGWINSDRFDITARAEASDTAAPANSYPATIRQQMQERLRNLLEERFKLTVHRDTKEQQVYALVVAKSGPKIQESNQGKNMMRTGRGLLTAQAVGMADFTLNLSNILGWPVTDKTGLIGKYDFELKWAPDPSQPTVAALGAELPPPPDPNGPSIFTAVQEQLGLRLESQKAPVEMLVIDRVERPSEN